ncbi:hypothetical protein SPI_05795 [Niveomyces insectorum RCEF 264]|uniref:Uncharacterized protein n=1 Tax=Niveomyces insectorum RCEF 264 TaxID=1081102 RepID=A0A167SG59_9HYPO|nr:hypothetical protein SPI_05795 [Niveomyces insectorum RCEF 264]
MDVAMFAAGPESYDHLSRLQIANFFASNTSATREQCDTLAAALLGGPVSATPIQGGSSYTYDDLLENNFHVDEETGRITDVVDWADAQVAPYGVSLGGLEIVLGI